MLGNVFLYINALNNTRFVFSDFISLVQARENEGQRGRLPVQALGYVNSAKVILGLPKTAGVHFLLRPHDTIIL